jgi:hypothetical protein
MRLAVLVEEDVVGLDVAMDDSGPVGIVESPAKGRISPAASSTP